MNSNCNRQSYNTSNELVLGTSYGLQSFYKFYSFSGLLTIHVLNFGIATYRGTDNALLSSLYLFSHIGYSPCIG